MPQQINKNQAVIDMNGLLGKTISIGAKASKVQIITDKNFAISVKVGDKMEKAIFKPDYGNRGFLEGVVKSVKLKKNDIIFGDRSFSVLRTSHKVKIGQLRDDILDQALTEPGAPKANRDKHTIEIS